MPPGSAAPARAFPRHEALLSRSFGLPREMLASADSAEEVCAYGEACVSWGSTPGRASGVVADCDQCTSEFVTDVSAAWVRDTSSLRPTCFRLVPEAPALLPFSRLLEGKQGNPLFTEGSPETDLYLHSPRASMCITRVAASSRTYARVCPDPKCTVTARVPCASAMPIHTVPGSVPRPSA